MAFNILKKMKFVACFIKLLKHCYNKILDLKKKNIAELKINKSLAAFNSDVADCNFFFVDFFATFSVVLKTVNKSLQASLNSEDSQ